MSQRDVWGGTFLILDELHLMILTVCSLGISLRKQFVHTAPRIFHSSFYTVLVKQPSVYSPLHRVLDNGRAVEWAEPVAPLYQPLYQANYTIIYN